jgi:hypothetical protein
MRRIFERKKNFKDFLKIIIIKKLFIKQRKAERYCNGSTV